MDNSSLMNRENKKRQLRRQIVPPMYQNEQESEQAIRNAHKKTVRKRMTIFIIAAVLLGGAAFSIYYYDRYHTFYDFQVVWEKSLTEENQEAAIQGEGSFCGYMEFGDGVIKYTKDGASYIDSRGKAIWIQSYEMKSPFVTVNGDFAAIGDKQGNSIYICDRSGCQGQVTTTLPVLSLSVSAKGVVASVQEDSKASYIYLYKKDGSALDIYVKSLLSGDGYPVDVSLSPGGTQWITSFMYLEQGMIKNKIVFYNFGLGKNDPKRVVGIFLPEDLSDAMAGRVRFMDESHAVAFTDKGLQFFSTRVETSPESTSQILLDENIRSISYNDQYAGVITDNGSGADPYCLRIYKPDGSAVFETTFSYQYTGFDIEGDLVMLYNDNSCCIYNMAGTRKFSGTFDFTVNKVLAGRFPGTIRVMGNQKMEEIRLK